MKFNFNKLKKITISSIIATSCVYTTTFADIDNNTINCITFPNLKSKNVSSVIKDVSNAVVSINIISTNIVNDKAFPVRSAGSGIIYKDDDDKVYIITNNHVVSGAKNVTVSLDDDTQLPAHYVGSNFESDLAVIYFNKSDENLDEKFSYKIAKFGESSNVEVGDSVIAIGNALGEGKTATLGIISATNKIITVKGVKLNVLQTDAAINPGNSGGALINIKGEVIGVNTAKLSHLGIEGMGYSLKSTEVMEIAEKIVSQENKSQAVLGIMGVNIDEEMKNIYGLPSIGILVSEVVPGSSAFLGNLKQGDIIVGFQEDKIETVEDLKSKLEEVNIGQKIDLYIYKGGLLPVVVPINVQGGYDITNF